MYNFSNNLNLEGMRYLEIKDAYVIFQTSIQIPSPVAGVIKSVLVQDGETVEAGAQLCTIEVGGRVH